PRSPPLYDLFPASARARRPRARGNEIARFRVPNARLIGGRGDMESGSSIAQLQRKRTRKKAALVLFGPAVVSTMAVASGWLGFMTGIRLQSSNYDPYAYGTGVGALFFAACAIIALMLMRQ